MNYTKKLNKHKQLKHNVELLNLRKELLHELEENEKLRGKIYLLEKEIEALKEEKLSFFERIFGKRN